jgi:hypothetical protein
MVRRIAGAEALIAAVAEAPTDLLRDPRLIARATLWTMLRAIGERPDPDRGGADRQLAAARLHLLAADAAGLVAVPRADRAPRRR